MGHFTAAAAKDASEILIKHWQEGTTLDELPNSIRPSSSEDGYAVQRHVQRTSEAPLFGWKIAATSSAGQRHIGVDHPLAGHILAERLTKYGEPVSLSKNHMRLAELEFVFRMGKSLEPRSASYKLEEVMDAVDGLFLGIELPDSRYTDCRSVGAAQLIADNACADRFVLGPEVEVDWRKEDLAEQVVKGWTSEDNATFFGKGAEVLGGPRIALTWIANELSEHGMRLQKGQFVTTGTCIVPMPIMPGGSMTGDFGDLGSVEVRFVE